MRDHDDWEKNDAAVCDTTGILGAVGAKDPSAIRAARLAQNRAIAADDLDAVAGFWTEDVAIRRGLGQAVTGWDASRKLFDRTRAGDSTLVYQRRTTGVEVRADWPLAFGTGTWAGHLGRAKGPAAIRGRYSAQVGQA